MLDGTHDSPGSGPSTLKTRDKGKLMLGYIHPASIDELDSWAGMVEEAKRNPDISVNSGTTDS